MALLGGVPYNRSGWWRQEVSLEIQYVLGTLCGGRAAEFSQISMIVEEEGGRLDLAVVPSTAATRHHRLVAWRGGGGWRQDALSPQKELRPGCAWRDLTCHDSDAAVSVVAARCPGPNFKGSWV